MLFGSATLPCGALASRATISTPPGAQAGSPHPAVPVPGPATAGPASAGGATHNTLNITIGSISYPAQLPGADEMERLEELAPGATRDLLDMQKQVVGMAADEQKHRHKMDTEESARRTRGQIIGPAIGALAIVGAVITGLLGHEEVAIALGGGTALGVTTVVVTGRLIPRGRSGPE